MNDIDLWLADCCDENIEYCRTFLNKAELARAQRYQTELLQRRFIAARAILKQILARYLQINPEQVLFALGPHGKPFLSGVNAAQDWVFNVSHSADKLAIVVAKAQQLGVDIEQHKTTASLPALVKKCFANSEKDFWESLPKAKQTAVFFDIWTRKEAFVKAVGRGIALGLDQCVTSVNEPEQWLSIPADYGQANAWQIINLAVSKDFSGAIVSNNTLAKVHVTPWETRTESH